MGAMGRITTVTVAQGMIYAIPGLPLGKNATYCERDPTS